MQVLAPENFVNPHALYRKLREHDPVQWDDYLHAWVVTSYREAVTVLTEYSADRTPKASRLDEVGLSSLKPFSEMMTQQMMFLDGAKHSRLRAICSAVFTPSRVHELKGHIEDIANSLLGEACKRGTMDLVAGFAAPLPAIVTAELLGVPSEDHEQLHAWVLDIAEVFGNYHPNPRRVSEIMRSLEDLRRYLWKQMESQRIHPSSGLMSSLMSAEVDGHRLSDEEVLANSIITLIGGHETTTNLVASGFLTLLRNPESLEELRLNPDITASSVEELLRYESPVQHTARIAPKDAQLRGKLIQEGSRVVVVLAAANRDPARFQDPDRLDLRRTDNRHLAFGWASHFCFGAPLARIEAQIAFSILVRRLSNPRLASQELEWRENAGLRSLRALPIRFDSCTA
jgi:cytochrome P450